MKYAVSVIALVCLCFHARASGQNNSWEAYIQAGDNAMAQRQYVSAEDAYRQALKLSERFKEKDPRLATTLIKLAESVNLQSRREEGEAFANRALVALEKAIKTGHPTDLSEEYFKRETSAMIFDKAAGVFVANRKYSEAEPIFKRLIALREEQARIKDSPKGNEDFLRVLGQRVTHAQDKIADANDKLANLYFIQRRYEEAEALYARSTKIREAEYGADKPPVAMSLSNLATLYAAQGRFDKAEPLYARAVTILNQSDSPDKPEVATIFQNYSLLLRRTGREDEANAMAEKARAIRMRLQQQDKH